MHVPTDEASLKLLEEAIDPGIEISLTRLLEFWSGTDDTKLIQIGDDVWEDPNPSLHYTDVISALIREVRRLRRGYAPE